MHACRATYLYTTKIMPKNQSKYSRLPTISLVTPSFNQAKFIRATIDSVLSQKYPHLEYWIIDGGSTDGTVDILKSYGKKIHWVSENDRGQSHAINKGLAKTSGEILAYLNSDDILLPGALQRVGEYYAKTRADWMTGDCEVIDETGNVILRNSRLISSYKRFLLRRYSPLLLRIIDNMLPQPSTFWSRHAYEQIGPFNESYHYVMDYDYWLRMSKQFRPHDLGVALSGFRAHEESKSETSRAKLMAEGDKALAANGATSLELLLHRAHSAAIRVVYNLLKG